MLAGGSVTPRHLGTVSMRILAIDIGTSSVKSAILQAGNLTPVSTIVSIGYNLDRPDAETATVPAERLWATVGEAVRAVVSEEAGQLEGIGFSCMTPAMLLLDGHGEPLTPVWTHFDRRSRPLARRLRSEPARFEAFLQHACNPPLPGGLSGLSAAKQLELTPEIRPKVRWLTHVNSWLTYRLTGEIALDSAGACFTGLYTAREHRWSEEWCAELGVSSAWLPPVVSGDQTLGRLRNEVAQCWNIPAGLPVKIGTADTSSAMLAAHMGTADLLHSVGTTQVLAAFADPPVPHERRLCRPLGVGSRFIHVTHNPVGGDALSWLFDLCYAGDRHPNSVAYQAARRDYFEQIVKKSALTHSTSVRLDPPFLGGDRLEIDERAAAFTGLRLHVRPIDLVAAVLNGMREGHSLAYGNLGVHRPWQRIILTGGGAEIVRLLKLPQYEGVPIEFLEDGSLRGVARLFENG
jgi:gluconokinase